MRGNKAQWRRIVTPSDNLHVTLQKLSSIGAIQRALDFPRFSSDQPIVRNFRIGRVIKVFKGWVFQLNEKPLQQNTSNLAHVNKY